MSKTQRITDLCMAINAVEGTDVAPEYIRQNQRVRNTLYKMMMEEADRLSRTEVTIKQLEKAIAKAGWEDQHFAMKDDGSLIIVVD